MTDDNPNETDFEELIDWLCWMWAQEGDRFYPPDETAEECAEALDLDDEFARGVERGQHVRAWSTAVERFQDMESRGLNPKARTVRYEEALIPSEDHVDWEWWEDIRSR